MKKSLPKLPLNLVWLFKMAWRDSRRNRGRLLLFLTAITLGIAALVAIQSFNDSLKQDIDRQSQGLLGADLAIESRSTLSPPIQQYIDSIAVEQASESAFASMILLPRTGDSRLVQVRALKGNFPFYGAIKTEPTEAVQNYRKRAGALLDKTLMKQFKVQVGDSVKVGTSMFVVEGALVSAPGQTGITASVAPAVYVSDEYLDKAALIQKGSRIEYSYYLKFKEGMPASQLASIEARLEQERLRYETVESRKQAIGRAFDFFDRFLYLVAFVALLLGCIGVASAVYIYLKNKLRTIAVLRCVGARSTQVFIIYLIQVVTMGFLGSVIGAILGSAIQTLLPQVLQDFLPFEISLSVSWPAIFSGILIGTGMSLLFALAPLLSLRKISPLRTIRVAEDVHQKDRDPLKWLVWLLIAASIFGFVFWQLGDLLQAVIFSLGIGIAFLLLVAVAAIVMWLTKRFFPTGWSYVWRQSIANLYRPNNQTRTLIVSIGLGTALLTTLFFIQNLLLDRVNLAGGQDLPNMILFDIQSSQKEGVKQLFEAEELPILQEAPIVTMRLAELNGQTIQDIDFEPEDIAFENEGPADEVNNRDNRRNRRTLSREYRISFRDYLVDTEEIIEGEWFPRVESPDDTIYISVAERFTKMTGLKMGDELTFNVQGALIKTVVGSIRKVDWARLQSNFFVLFPAGVLEEAPQFHILVTRSPSKEVTARFQQQLVLDYPNVSAVDLDLILSTVEDVLSKVSFVIQFMALFSILTGLMVLIGSVILSKFQRVKESVLLRTLGAQSGQILKINALEYFLLGSLASLTGILLALVGSYLLARFSFKISFVPEILPIITIYVIITSLTVIIGLLNSREVVSQSPLAVLRGQ